MGMMLGKITVETPKHEVIHTGAGYEVRKYPPCVAVEFTYDPKEWKGDPDGGFTVLANYIGALGKPQNTKPEKIAMTAPVITTGGGGGGEGESAEKIAMTAPVITSGAGGGGRRAGGGRDDRAGDHGRPAGAGQGNNAVPAAVQVHQGGGSAAADGRAGGDSRGAGEEVRGGEVQRGGYGQDGEGEGGGAQGRAGEGRVHHQGPLRAGAVQPAVHAPAAAHQRGHDPRRVGH